MVKFGYGLGWGDGEALLLALVRRKGSPAALADWLLERKPVELSSPVGAVRVDWRTGEAFVQWHSVQGDSVWLGLIFRWAEKNDVTQAVHIDTSHPLCGRQLAYHLNSFFIKRRRNRRERPLA